MMSVTTVGNRIIPSMPIVGERDGSRAVLGRRPVVPSHLSRSSVPIPVPVCHATRSMPRCHLLPSNATASNIEAVTRAVQAIWTGNVKGAFEERTSGCRDCLALNPDYGLGECINKIRNLWLHECSCAEFDRLTSDFRTRYEDRVIQSTIEKASIQVKEKGYFSINLSFYRPGKLASEAILCTRLCRALVDQGLQGTLNFSLIDPAYQGIVQKGRANDSTFSNALNDFNTVLRQLEAGTNIKMGVAACFESSEDYQKAVHEDPRLRHDLFLGSDLGGEQPNQFALLVNVTQKTNAQAIILYTNGNGRKLWINGSEESLDQTSSKPVKPIKAKRIETPKVQPKDESVQGDNTGLVLIGVLLAVVIVIAVLRARKG